MSKAPMLAVLMAGLMTTGAAQAQATPGDELDGLLSGGTSSSTPEPAPPAAGAPQSSAPAKTEAADPTAATPPPSEALPVTAEAKDADSAPADKSHVAPPHNRLIEEIVVTARKREESIQDVPLSISAFSADKLDAVGIDSAQKLDKVTPGLVFSNSLGFNVVFLRGIGTDAYLPAADPSVPIYVDDIAVLPTQGSVDTLDNIERVEVLKGPQGTLFGRNSLGGAIRIVTKTPDDSAFSGDAKAEMGNLGTRNESVYLNVPVTHGLAFAVSAFDQEQHPYYSDNANPGFIFPVYAHGGRLSIYWKPNDDIDLRLTGSTQQASTISGLVLEGTRPAPIVCAICAADSGPDYNANINVPGGSKTHNWLASAQFGWKLPWFDNKIILSDQRLDIPYASTDLDGTSAPLVTAFTNTEYGAQRTAEIRFESNQNTPFNERLNWVVGAFYLHSDGGYYPVQFSIGENLLTAIPNGAALNNQLFGLLNPLGIDLQTGVTLFSTGIIDTKSTSGFGQANFTFFDDFVLTAGLRYDTESRSLNDSKLEAQNPIGGAKIPVFHFSVPEINSSRYSPRVSVQWNFREASQIYTSFAIGFLSPTYNSVNFLTAPDFVPQERDNAYELGIKTSLFDGLLTLDAAAFYTQRYDIISAYTTITSGVAVRFYDAGPGVARGAEFSLQAQPLPDLDPGLAILASGTFLSTEYTGLPNGRGYDEKTGLGFGPSSLTGLPRDETGNRIVNSPTFSGTTTIAQTIPVGNTGSVELAFDAYYNSGFFFTPQNSKLAEQTSYELFNARTTYLFDPWKAQVSGYVENLANKKYLSSVFQFDTGTSYQLAMPRTYGVRLKWSF